MRVGEVLGRYCVTDVIGRGGMAVVYAGQHLVLGHAVAIKVLHPDHLSNPVMERRFINEARALAALHHPGIVALLDAGCTAEGRGYMVMELIDGESLAARLERGPLPLGQAVSFGRQLASALAAAHAQGIVHRDLKPANIVLCPDLDLAPGERAKLVDFGIAKRIANETPAPITASGIIVGTPEYMSPEQCRGDDEIDARSDIYCLGLVLHHMVTGEYPFTVGSETQEILAQHLYGQSAPVSRVDPTAPAALSRIIARCMAKLPARRYQEARELETELAEIEELIGAHEVLSATGEHERATRPMELRLTRETEVRSPTLIQHMRGSARQLSLVLIAAGAAAVSAMAIRWPRSAPHAVRAASEPPVAAARAPAPVPAPMPEVAPPAQPPPTPAPAPAVVAEQPEPPHRARVARRAEPRRRAAPPPRPAPAPPPPREESYEDIDTPVVY
jgi:serine/threonine-protein kinase